MDEELKKVNIKQLFKNLTTRYKKTNTMNVGYDAQSGQNVIYVKVMLTDREKDFMEQYLEEEK